MSVLPLERTEVPGVYRRGRRYVVVARVRGRQRKQTVDTSLRLASSSATWTLGPANGCRADVAHVRVGVDRRVLGVRS